MDIFYPLQFIADKIAYNLLGLLKGSHLGDAVNFFLYDSLKILILLLIINYFMAILRHYLPVEKLRDFLASRKWYGFDYFLAAIFGTITPFCSCSSIPLFIGFLEAGIPLGVTLSFLIVSPLVNQVAVALFVGLFGWKIAILYVVSTILLGMVGGLILNKLKLEKYVADYVWKIKGQKLEIKSKKIPVRKLLKIFWSEGLVLTKKITIYVLLGIALGAVIHSFVPTGFFEKYITVDNLLAVPIATIVAVPMYANAVGVIPIMQSLVEKGIPLGTAMAFMMAVVGLSLPEALILKRVMKMKLLVYFFGITTINIIIVGYLFNLFLH
ncbi:MAG TPA: permease [bacterium]|nr:permease [bacterium]HPV65521.1 permease [bacterium]